MTVTYAVSFEFDVQGPITLRGRVSASSMPTCARLAMKDALSRQPRQQWRSVVLVLERAADVAVPADEAA